MTWADKLIKMAYFLSNPAWYYYESEDDDALPVLAPDAPPEAIESYNLWKEWHEEQQRTGEIIM